MSGRFRALTFIFYRGNMKQLDVIQQQAIAGLVAREAHIRQLLERFNIDKAMVFSALEQQCELLPGDLGTKFYINDELQLAKIQAPAPVEPEMIPAGTKKTGKLRRNRR